MMRNSGWILLVIAIAALGAKALAQDEIQIKADEKASKASRFDRGSRTAGSSTETPASIAKLAPSIFAQSEPVTVATWNGGFLTNLEVSATLSARRPMDMANVPPERFSAMSKKEQENIIRKLAWEQILIRNAKASGISENTPAVAVALAQQEEALLNRYYYQSEIIPALNASTLETARNFYNSNLDQYTESAETIVRALHVSTYEMVTAEEGDTLKDFAEKISGDVDAAGRIIEALPPFYLRDNPPALDDKALSAPLKSGEVLYVPMGKEAVTSATEFAKSLRGELLAGKSIDEIEKETSNADFTVSATQPVRISSAVGYWDELTKAAQSLNDTSVSQVIKTPTGLNILVLADKTTTNVVPFSKVQDDLMNRVVTDETQKRATIEKTRKEVLDHLWKKYKVEINDSIISRPNHAGADPLSTNTTIAKAGDFVYNLEQFLIDMRMTGKTWGELSRDERIQIVHVSPSITNHIIAKEARSLGLDKTDDFQKAINGIRDSLIVSEYRKVSQASERRITDDRLRAYYQDNLDKYTSAAQVTLREISKRINMTLTPSAKAEAISNAKKSLAEIKTRIRSEEDFAQLARRESEAISTRSRGGLIGTVSEDFRGAAFKNELRQLEIGQVSDPFMYGSEIMIVRIDSRTAPTVQPFEDVRRQVMKDFAATEPRKMVDREMETDLKNSNFQLKY